MLFSRILAAAAMILALAAALAGDLYWFKKSLLLHGLFLLCAWQSFREFWPLCRAADEETFSNWGTGGGCALVLAHYWLLNGNGGGAPDMEGVNLLWGVMAVVFLGAFLLSARRGRYTASLGSLGATYLGLLYLWFLPSFILKLRHLGVDGSLGGQGWLLFGHKMVVATIVVAKGCDLSAYACGRLWGRRKAFPRLSPGKTIAGVSAGLAGAILLAFLLRLRVFGVLTPLPVWGTAVFGLAVGFSGMMGDLTASLLKRSAGAKDAGMSVPGYGGVLDVVDSLIVAGPVAYFLVPVIIRA